MITRAEPAPKTVVGEVLKLAMISDVSLKGRAGTTAGPRHYRNAVRHPVARHFVGE